MEQQNACTKTYTGSFGMPRMHLAAYQGDLHFLKQCIRDGDDVNATIDLPNQHHHLVIGVTPLYLAAQAGHREACEILVQAGADIMRQCAVPESGDVFGPTDIALVHFKVRTWMYLKGVKQQRLARISSQSRFKASFAEPLVEQSHLVI
eukprot:GHRR01001840.1.p1 GENE.GHRR01001840.1~~GHRR01001840.1.p1  ORF type:complete len:149 (+),score=43.17 GHRR01001840.1:275-721(+)